MFLKWQDYDQGWIQRGCFFGGTESGRFELSDESCERWGGGGGGKYERGGGGGLNPTSLEGVQGASHNLF